MSRLWELGSWMAETSMLTLDPKIIWTVEVTGSFVPVTLKATASVDPAGMTPRGMIGSVSLVRGSSRFRLLSSAVRIKRPFSSSANMPSPPTQTTPSKDDFRSNFGSFSISLAWFALSVVTAVTWIPAIIKIGSTFCLKIFGAFFLPPNGLMKNNNRRGRLNPVIDLIN